MATLYNSDLKPLASGDYTHYYDHATKLFLADNFRLAPKQKFLYYVCINMNQEAVQSILPGFGGNDPVSSQTLIEQYETGLMAKRVDLPRFNIRTRTLKAYNRKNVFQTGIDYDPINITFHDDAADTVTKFWNDFYTFYYRDSDYDPRLYQVPHKYEPRPRQGWGFSPRNRSARPFLRNIQIFSLHNKRFTEYLLVNPVITAWRHGDHDSSASNELMESTMTVEFETVKYSTGYVNPVDVNGFAVIHYDDTPSPISNSVTNIYTDSGLIGALAEGKQDLYRPDGAGSGSGILGSVLNAYRFYNNLTDTNFQQLGGIVLGQLATQVLGGAINGATQEVFFPTLGSSIGYSPTYGGSQLYNTLSNPVVSPYSTPGYGPQATLNGQAAATIPGAGFTITNPSNLINEYTRGVLTTGSAPPNPGSTALYQAVQTPNSISVDSRSGQPATNQITSFILDSATGEVIQEFTTVGTQSGTYDSNNPAINLRIIQEEVDQNGQTILRYEYADNTKVWFSPNGDQLRVETGAGTNLNNFNTNPTNTRTVIQQGGTVSPTATQYYTDPITGITRVVNGGIPGLVRNTLSGTAGGVTGLAVGSELYGGIKDAFGGGLIASTVAAGISGVAATAAGIGVNNLVQSGLDFFFGTPAQSFNPVTGQIQNIVGSKVGTGAYTSQYPGQNAISVVDNGNGTRTVNTVDGGSSIVDNLTNSVISSVKGLYGDFTSWLGSFGQNQDASILLPDPGMGYILDGSGNPVYSLNESYDQGTLEAWTVYEVNNNYFDALGPSWESYFQSETSADFAFLQPEFDLGV